jgi:radical SAM protein with 4Fe4S-binding SPASM domain
MKAQDWDNKLFSRIEIEINHDCNRKCWYCPNAVAERKTSGEMSEETFLKIMDELNLLDYRGNLSFHFYNEPMLAKKFLWFIQTARQRLPHSFLELYTNGTLLTFEKFTQIVDLGMDRFIVTKHFGEKNFVFDETFGKLTDDQKKKVSYQGHTDIQMTNRGGLVDAGPGSVPALSPCYIPNILMVITHDGNVLPCFEDFDEKMKMGNILESNLLSIWNSEKYQSHRRNLRMGKRHLYSPCSSCNRLEVLPK